MMKRGLVLCLAAAASCWALPITNNSFESPIQAPGGFSVGTVTGWTVTGFAGVWAPQVPTFLSSIPDGNQVLFEGFNQAGDVNQSLGVSLAPNTTYTLTFFVGQR